MAGVWVASPFSLPFGRDGSGPAGPVRAKGLGVGEGEGNLAKQYLGSNPSLCPLPLIEGRGDEVRIASGVVRLSRKIGRWTAIDER